MRTEDILTFTPNGIYCPAGDFYIDPWRLVPRAVITHGHADHARFGHQSYLSTDMAAPIIKLRLGDIVIESVSYGATVQIASAKVSFHPAGHVPGSAQIRVEVGGEVWVVSGDYKTEYDGLSDAFEPVKCHSFISECTFGLPVFRWKRQSLVFDAINSWWWQNANEGRVSLLGAYGLGKAQRLICGLDQNIGPVRTHSAVEGTNRVMRAQGIALPPTQQVMQDTDRKAQSGAIIIAPPSALESTWARGFGDISTAFASGWMGLRGVRRRRAIDRGFVISDHADWEGLNSAILQTGAENIYVTHGYTDIFSRWLTERGFNAKVVPTQFGDAEEEESKEA